MSDGRPPGSAARVPANVMIVAIVALAVLEIVALLQGINGLVFTGVMTAIAGIGGFQLNRVAGVRRQVLDERRRDTTP